MKKDKIAYNTYLVTFQDQKDLCKTMLRFQEHYESPEFAGCTFSLNEFKDWYSRENGEFSYYSDWNGFNIPSYVLDSFYGDGTDKDVFKNITDREQKFLDLFADIRGEDFYIIAVHKGEPDAYLHELIHAMYYHLSDYRKHANRIISKHKSTKYFKELTKHLNEIGYTKDVIYDEVNAYTVCDYIIINIEPPVGFKKELQKIAEKFMVKFQN